MTSLAPVRWDRSRYWLYVMFILVVTTYTPEVRRLFDWKSGFAAISVLSILPSICTLPAVYVFPKLLERANRTTLLLAFLWFGAFGYGLAIAVVSGNILGGIYSFIGFVFPLCLAYFINDTTWSTIDLYDRIASFLLLIATPAAIYGLIQFASPPAWDVAWVQHANIDSLGKPYPFQLRVFSVLNAPGPFADFIALVLLLNIPRIGLRHPLRVAQVGLLLLVLTLTLVRSSWIAAAIGVGVFILLSPGRVKNLTILMLVGLFAYATMSNASTIFGDDRVGTDLNARFSTFTDLRNDASYNDRQKYYGQLLDEALTQPIGIGLGEIGTAAKLGDAGETVNFDNGYLARFTELGYFGFAAYLATIAIAFAVAVRAFLIRSRKRDVAAARVAATVLAVQIALLFLDVSGDHHGGFDGIFFWISVILSVRLLDEHCFMIKQSVAA